MDTAFHRRFKFILEFGTPDAATRTKLWRQLVPKEAPLEEGVDFEALGERFELSGGYSARPSLLAALPTVHCW